MSNFEVRNVRSRRSELLASISFIGGGVRGEAMIVRLLSQKLVNPTKITASEPRQKRREELQNYAINVTADNREAARNSRVVVFSLKPQDLNHLLAELKGLLKPEQLVLSIVSGHGNCRQRHWPHICFPSHGGHDRRSGSSWVSATRRLRISDRDDAGLYYVRHKVRETSS